MDRNGLYPISIYYTSEESDNMPKGDRPNRFKIIPKEEVEKEIMLGKQLAPSKQARKF